MSIVFRFGLVVLLALFAAIFLWQNLIPIVGLILFGIRLPELPLAVWIAAAFGLGVLISLLFWLLIALARRSPIDRRRKISSEEPAEPWDDETWDPATQNTPPPRKVVDAEFRVITPPQRNLEEDDL